MALQRTSLAMSLMNATSRVITGWRWAKPRQGCGCGCWPGRVGLSWSPRIRAQKGQGIMGLGYIQRLSQHSNGGFLIGGTPEIIPFWPFIVRNQSFLWFTCFDCQRIVGGHMRLSIFLSAVGTIYLWTHIINFINHQIIVHIGCHQERSRIFVVDVLAPWNDYFGTVSEYHHVWINPHCRLYPSHDYWWLHLIRLFSPYLMMALLINVDLI